MTFINYNRFKPTRQYHKIYEQVWLSDQPKRQEVSLLRTALNDLKKWLIPMAIIWSVGSVFATKTQETPYHLVDSPSVSVHAAEQPISQSSFEPMTQRIATKRIKRLRKRVR